MADQLITAAMIQVFALAGFAAASLPCGRSAAHAAPRAMGGAGACGDALVAETQRDHVMHWEIGMDLAERAVLDLLESGWSRQSLRKHEAAGPTPCGSAFYLLREGGIAVAYFPIAKFTDANGRGLSFPICDCFPPVHKSAHGDVESLKPFEVGDLVLSMDRELVGSWYYDDEVRASEWHLLIPVFTVVSVRPRPGHHTQFGGRDYYQVSIKDRVGGGASFHDLVPIAGRPWQMRGEGECLIRVDPTPLAVAAPPPALPAQLDLFP